MPEHGPLLCREFVGFSKTLQAPRMICFLLLHPRIVKLTSRVHLTSLLDGWWGRIIVACLYDLLPDPACPRGSEEEEA